MEDLTVHLRHVDTELAALEPGQHAACLQGQRDQLLDQLSDLVQPHIPVGNAFLSDQLLRIRRQLSPYIEVRVESCAHSGKDGNFGAQRMRKVKVCSGVTSIA